MNLKIKFCESFRPFAPCVLREHVHEWFGMKPNQDSPYMLLVAPVLEKHRTALSADERTAMLNDADLLRRVKISRSSVPAITHVDCSARVQTVDERHGLFRRVMEKFHEKTGCPVIVNTSFNLSWEPIVCTPQEAYNTFMQSEMDVLVLENFLLQKSEQPLGLRSWGTIGQGEPHPSSPWADPRTGEPLLVTTEGAINAVTGRKYSVEDGIPRLFLPDDRELDSASVTDRVEEYYEKTPLPSYDDVDSVRALLEKARSSRFTRLLNEQIPFDARVVEVGCGTGQLTNFLSIGHRSVVGTDMCLNSLTLAQNFKKAHGLERSTFAQMNPFRPALRDEFFDFVISNGVLPHIRDPRRAFARISRLARPGGFVIVGLRSAYGGKSQYARRALYRWVGLGRVSGEQKRAGDATCHTLDEVFGWLHENGLDFVNAIPKPAGGDPTTERERLFEPKNPGSTFSRIVSQLRSMPNGYQDGGFFIVIARRR
jgi:SAM-dependent methyltransferase